MSVGKVTNVNISYTELVEVLESKADITLVSIENEEPYQFRRMGYFDNIEGTRKIFFDFR